MGKTNSPYGLRISEERLAELQVLAEAEGEKLPDAFRLGARMYLMASPEERAAVATAEEVRRKSDGLERAKADLTASVDRARTAMRTLG